MKYVAQELKTIINKFFDVLKISSAGIEFKLDSVYREVESQRIKSSFVNIIPYTLILAVIEIASSIYNILTTENHFCEIGFIASSTVFLVFNVFVFSFLEKTLKDGEAKDKKKEYFTYFYWAFYTICAICFSSFETLSSGSISHFFVVMFMLTLLPVLEPNWMVLYYSLSIAVETVMLLIKDSPYPSFIFCYVTTVVGIVLSYVKYSNYMTKAIETKRFERISEVDPLTGLLNRRGMQRSVDGIWNYCKTHSIPLTVAMLDIDYFKKYNDMYGHSQGDECLKKIANCIKQSFSRRTDITCRFGGEEFIIIVAGDNQEKAIKHLQKLCNSVEALEIKSGNPDFNKNVTISMGIYSVMIEDNMLFRDVVLSVDEELYHAKENGRNCVSYKGEILK